MKPGESVQDFSTRFLHIYHEIPEQFLDPDFVSQELKFLVHVSQNSEALDFSCSSTLVDHETPHYVEEEHTLHLFLVILLFWSWRGCPLTTVAKLRNLHWGCPLVVVAKLRNMRKGCPLIATVKLRNLHNMCPIHLLNHLSLQWRKFQNFLESQ